MLLGGQRADILLKSGFFSRIGLVMSVAANVLTQFGDLEM